ncbi:TPA: hypothetical protein JW587_004025 [Escherichia coli]|nr:hypothetical protein [Escherichia coli]
MKRAGEAGKALRAGGGADFIFSASERVVKAFTRVDESLAALYGDIGKQAESLIGKAGSMATKFTGMTGAG